MDNANKALIIAAGFLIAMMVISLFMYLLTTFRDFKSQSDLAKERIEINAFNSRFYEFITPKGDASENTIKGYQLYNLLSLAAEENSKPDSISSVTINGINLNNNDFRDKLFYYTENLQKDFKVTKVNYLGGVIDNINITDAAGNAINVN